MTLSIQSNSQSVSHLAFGSAKMPEKQHGFRNLGDNAEKVAQEVDRFGLKDLPEGVSAERKWGYWDITLDDKTRLPKKVSTELNNAWGKVVRAFGYSGGMFGERFEKWTKRGQGRPGGVNNWHVDTQEGLTKLVTTLKEHLPKSK